jgi:hypothetical protein
MIPPSDPSRSSILGSYTTLSGDLLPQPVIGHATLAASMANPRSHVSVSVREWGLIERIKIVNCQMTIYP